MLCIAEYTINGFNGTEAYLMHIGKKGMTRGTAAAQMSEMLKKPKIQSALRLLIDRWLGEQKSTFEKRIIEQLNIQAFYDPSMFIDTEGSAKFKSWDDIPEQYRCCVEGIETRYYGKDAEQSATTIKLVNRVKAREELSKYITLFREESMKLGLTDDTLGKLAHIFRGGKVVKK